MSDQMIATLAALVSDAAGKVRAVSPGFGADPVQAALFDATGRIMAASSMNVLASSTAALARLRGFFKDDWSDGDAAVTNDADAGAANACEMLVVAPVFTRGVKAPKGFALVRGRVPDFGGWEIGGYSPQAVDRWAEGARVEPVKLAVGAHLRREVTDILQLNTRTPRLTLRRVTALLAAARSIAGSWRAEFDEAAGSLRAAEEDRIERALAVLPTSTLRASEAIVLPAVNRTLGAIEVRARRGGPGLELELAATPDGAVAALPVNLGPFAAQDSALAAVAAACNLTTLHSDALARRIAVRTETPSLLTAPLPSTVGFGRETSGRALFCAVVAALSAEDMEANPDRLWRAYEADVLGDGFDPATARLSTSRTAAIIAQEAKEPAQ